MLQTSLTAAACFVLPTLPFCTRSHDCGGLVKASEPSGTIGLQIVIYVATVLFSACVTNNAAVTIMFPIAYQAAQDVGQDFRIFMYLLMMGASASFMTPTGYQTNLMVYGPGGYRFMDFVKFGGALQIYIGVITIAVLQTLHLWWLWTLCGCVGIAAVLCLDVMCCKSSGHERRSNVGGSDSVEETVTYNLGRPSLRKRLNSFNSNARADRAGRVDRADLDRASSSDSQRGLIDDAAAMETQPLNRLLLLPAPTAHGSVAKATSRGCENEVDPRSTLQV